MSVPKSPFQSYYNKDGEESFNIASTSGMTGGTSGAHYAAAKGGVIAFTKALSSEFAKCGITVNVIVPSKIETDMFYNSIDGYLKN